MPRANSIKLKPIGTVGNGAESRSDLINFKSMVSELKINRKYEKGLKGVENYTHLIILFHLHKTDAPPGIELVTRPGLRTHLPKVGIFSTRNTLHRVNRLGLTVVEFLGRRSNVVKVKGLDALNDSPVLDIKTYTINDIAGPRRIRKRTRGDVLFCDVSAKITIPAWWSRF